MEALLLCNDGIGMVKRLLRGVEVSDETLALEVIESVGPGGNYLAAGHTRKHYREMIWQPDLLNRMAYDNWKNAGAMTFGERANLRVREILENHKVKELPRHV
jgi:trimethylamine--corrinoid protein Co-methyltransferase